jgi:N-methylhydantoinase B
MQCGRSRWSKHSARPKSFAMAFEPDSCGDGEFRGGCGILREIRVLSRRRQSVGAGGQMPDPTRREPRADMAARRNRFVVIRGGAVIEPSPIPGKVGGFALRKGDIVRIETAGGGGYGDPLMRDPARVQREVELGVLTPTRARARYGVAFDEHGSVDAEATRQGAAHERGARCSDCMTAGDDEFDGTRRRIRVSP